MMQANPMAGWGATAADPTAAWGAAAAAPTASWGAAANGGAWGAVQGKERFRHIPDQGGSAFHPPRGVGSRRHGKLGTPPRQPENSAAEGPSNLH